MQHRDESCLFVEGSVIAVRSARYLQSFRASLSRSAFCHSPDVASPAVVNAADDTLQGCLEKHHGYSVAVKAWPVS